ncbi:CbiX/SirB N-terminal domain-containing protein [Natronomonas salsuginis]|uniref:Sirohydrochlorin chelatase n=1 Tax=Natronomonas salsuginis TaxID=2217661 RepID=A0A4U5J9P7_9EURY|nr:CbiX/SirB N-terminal domain-containing protein [Natronomonas salsuginis]TKR25494.1 sirohydrochlorin chelatase [Natronomonas salsuginis]
MTDTLVLVGRRHTERASRRHAERLRDRAVADRVVVATYENEPTELAESAAIRTSRVDAGDDTYVVPMAPAPDHDTTRAIPGALPRAHHCEPVGTSPAIVRGLADRAEAVVTPGEEASLALVAFGETAGSKSHATTEEQATRLRETTTYGEVATAYLVQNPAVECLRYNLSGDRTVVVPFFLAACEESERAIPEKLELDRGGLAYADPLGTHEAVTDAIEAEFAKARALGSGTATVRPVATDGRGH